MLTLSLSAQAFAGALLPCQVRMQSADQGHGAMPMSSMAHTSAMDHSQMSADSMETLDCCLEECKCPKAACASLAILNTQLIQLELPIGARLLSASVEPLNTQLSKLIRPPQKKYA